MLERVIPVPMVRHFGSTCKWGGETLSKVHSSGVLLPHDYANVTTNVVDDLSLK